MANRRGIGFYVAILAIFILMAFLWSRMQQAARAPIDHETYESYLDSDDIRSIELIQNAEVPTGEVRLLLNNGLTMYMYTSDINQIANELNEKYPTYVLNDVKREGWFTAYVLPSLIIVVLMIVFFTYMNLSLIHI